MTDVNRFLDSGDDRYLDKYRGEGVTDVTGKTIPFEVEPNVLYRLDAAGELSFPEFYKIIAPGADHGFV